MAQVPPQGFGPSEDFIPVGSFDAFGGPGPLDGPPMVHGGEGHVPFTDPFPHTPNVQYAQPRQPSPPHLERYNDNVELGRRISAMQIREESRDRSQKRNGNDGRRKSILVRRRSSSAGKISKVYQLHRLEKAGDDWTVADTFEISAPEKEIEEKIKKGQRNGSVSEQLAKMKPARREQVMKLLEELNDRENDNGLRWAPVSIENKDVQMTSRDTRDIRAMEIVFKRSSQPRRPTTGRAPSEPYLRRKSDLREIKKSKDKDKDKKDGKDKGEEKKEKLKDDPFQSTLLFTSDGVPMNEQGPIHFENNGLPPHLPKEEPIGKPLPPRSKSHGNHPGRTSGEFFGEIDAHHQGGIPPPPAAPGVPEGNLDMQKILYGAGDSTGAVIIDDHDPNRGRVRRDSGVALPIQHRGSLSRARSAHRVARSHSRGARSKSRSRVIYVDPRAADRLDRYFPAYSSVSSGDDGRSVIHGDIEERSTNTSDSIHNDTYPLERGYSHSSNRRRYSSKHEQAPFPEREHYPGPSYRPVSPARYPRGEQILIPERRPTLSRGQRPVSLSFVPQTTLPLRRAITNGVDDRDPERYGPTSPRRGGRELEIFHPSELERDRVREMYVDGHIADKRREQELQEREYRLLMAEREHEDREREWRRNRGYFAPGGFNVMGGDRYVERGYGNGYGDYRR